MVAETQLNVPNDVIDEHEIEPHDIELVPHDKGPVSVKPAKVGLKPETDVVRPLAVFVPTSVDADKPVIVNMPDESVI